MANVFAGTTRCDGFQFWHCRACGQKMGYQQPINFELELSLLASFVARHEAEHEVASRPAHYLPDATKLANWPRCDTSTTEEYGRAEPFCHTYSRAPWDKFISLWPFSGEIALREYQKNGRDYKTLFSGCTADEQAFDKLLADFKFQSPTSLALEKQTPETR